MPGHRQDIDHIAGTDHVYGGGVGQRYRHYAGVLAGGRLRQSGTQHPYVGQHFAATNRSGQCRAEQCGGFGAYAVGKDCCGTLFKPHIVTAQDRPGRQVAGGDHHLGAIIGRVGAKCQ
ncbi:Uncharacterised protein [Mycobacteroides abscessus subsp. abscessus]|nr:Uncharacterised protein [Mycobacteroides abscessus subsp. abscessus]